MSEKSGLEGSYSTVERTKRQQEVLERAKAGVEPKKIAADLGVAEYAVQQIVERLRADGSLPADGPAPDAG
jgi:DNA-binding NarL/FixJ family response regulator